MSTLEPYEIAPLVFVYPGVYKDAPTLVDALENGPKGINYSIYDWEPWEGRGKHATINPGLQVKLEEDDNVFDAVRSFVSAYDEIFADYISRKNIQLSGPVMSNIACNYYEEGASMGFHTDSDPEDEQAPYYSITVNCYLNDDYEGGDLVFNLSTEENAETVRYTPKAGDFVVIPASPPYLHKSEKIISGKKYFSHRVVTEDKKPIWQLGV
jgi:hypothetical protein